VRDLMGDNMSSLTLSLLSRSAAHASRRRPRIARSESRETRSPLIEQRLAVSCWLPVRVTAFGRRNPGCEF